MNVITVDTVRAARERLHRYGLLKDGRYGTVDGPCCTVGHIIAALYPGLPGGDIGDGGWVFVMFPVVAKFDVWRPGFSLIKWNDFEATEDDVDAFYSWWIEQLEAER